MAATACLENSNRSYQLIRRSPVTGEDRVVIDVLSAPENVSEQDAGYGISLGENMAGLYHLPMELPVTKGAHTKGVYVSKWPRVGERRGRLTFMIKGRDWQEWQRFESLLWWVLRVDETCILRIFNFDGTYRDLTLQMPNEPGDQPKHDLGMRRWSTHTVDYLAADPLWYSDDLTATIKRSDMVLNNTTGWYEGAVPVTNPADYRNFLQWSQAPMTPGAPGERWAITDAVLKPPDPDDLSNLTLGRLIEIQHDFVAGSEFHVDTDPSAERLWIETLDDMQVPALMPGIQPENALPPHLTDTVMLPVRMKGGTANSSLTCIIPQGWQRHSGGEAVF